MHTRSHRVIAVMAFLGITGASSLAPGRAAAQEAPAAEPELPVEEVVVTATRLPDVMQELRRVPGQVYVITAEEIQRQNAQTVQDALRQLPSIVTYDSVGNVFQSTVDMRGFNGQPGPGISVFVDGVRMNEPDSNQVNFDLIPIQDVERIEVLPGATAVFGANALGGVINIVTKKGGASPQTTVQGSLGSYKQYQVTASTSGPVKDFNYYFLATQNRESGFRDFSDTRLTNFTGRVGYNPSQATSLSLSYAYVNDHLEQAGTLPLDALGQNRHGNISPTDFSATEQSTVTFQGTQRLPWGFSVAGTGYYRYISRELQTIGLTSEATAGTGTDTAGGIVQLSNELQKWGRRNLFTAGAELSYSKVTATTNGSFLGFPFVSQRQIDQDVLGLYAQDSVDIFPELTLTGAVRYDVTTYNFEDQITPANSGDKKFNHITPRAGLTYSPLPVLTAYFNYGQGFRVPTTDELFAFGVGSSNPDLVPVTSQTYELGLRARPLSWLETTAALFLTYVQDEIIFDPTVPPFGRNINSPESRRSGVELGVRARPLDWLDVQLNYSYTDARYQSTATLATGTINPGDRVALVPLNRVYAGVTVRPLRGLELNLNGQYIGQQVLLNNESTQSTFRVQDAFVLNGSASYTWKFLTAFIQGNNLTNAQYETFGILSAGQVFLMPAPGINCLAGLRLQFKDYY